MSTLTITANPSSPWTEGDTITLTAEISGETEPSAKVTWSAEPATAVTFTGSTTTDVTDGKATISATAAAAGPVTFTATGDTADSGGTEGTLTGAITAAVTYDYIINSDSHFWATNLVDFAKTFSFVFFEKATGTPKSGVSCTGATATDPGGTPVTLTVVNKDASSDNHGVLALAVRPSGAYLEGIYTLHFVFATDDEVPVTIEDPAKDFRLDVVNPTLSQPRYPLASDSIIDDADVEAGVVCYGSPNTVNAGEVYYLRLDDYAIEHTISSADVSLGTVVTSVDQSLLTNGVKNSFYYVVSFSGNTSFSEVTQFFVERENDGAGVVDLAELDVPEGDDGYINKMDADFGVTINIDEPALADNSTANATLVSRAYMSDGTYLSTVIYSFPAPDPDTGTTITFNDSDSAGLDYALRGQFYSVGQGYVELTYEMTKINPDTGLNEKHSSTPARYMVDVVLPGQKKA